MNHTPGPWDFFVGNANGRGLIRIEAGNSSPEAGKHIASLTRGITNEANARLIAAAPDMLEALIDHVKANMEWQPEWAIKLIEKATGLPIEEVMG